MSDKPARNPRSIADALAMPEAADIEFERADIELKLDELLTMPAEADIELDLVSQRIAAKLRAMADQIERGERTPESLFAIPRELIERARMTFPPKVQQSGKGWELRACAARGVSGSAG
jgi:hypothetical protein